MPCLGIVEIAFFLSLSQLFDMCDEYLLSAMGEKDASSARLLTGLTDILTASREGFMK